MMTDIVEELENTWVGSGSGTILHDAKIEILRLRAGNKDLADRITEYLQAGGLFNPELMDQFMVQELLFECRAALDNKSQQSQYEKTKPLIISG